MDEHIENLYKLAGNANKYQYILSIITFLLWVNVNNLSVSVGLLEKTPDVTYYDNKEMKYINASLNSTICGWKDNFTFVKNYTQSVVTAFNVDCDSLLIGIIGSAIFAGNLIGCFLFQYSVDKYGRRKNVIISCIPYFIFCLGISLSPNYYVLIICFLLSELFCVNLAFSTYLINSENTESKLRSFFGSFINSAFGFCGVIYTLFYKYIDNWRYVFIICLISNTIIVSLFICFSKESPRYYLNKNDFLSFINSLKQIAKINGKLQNFEDKINEENSIYKIAYDSIESFIRNKSENRTSLEKYKINKNSDKDLSTEKNLLENDVEEISPQNETEDIFLDLDAEDLSIGKIINKKKKIKQFSIFDLVRYRSIRYKFLSLSFIWLTASGTYYGLSINLKNLNGDLYFNAILNYFFEIIIYYIGGFMINVKFLGRKKTLLIFYILTNIGFFSHIFLTLDDSLHNLVLFLSRLSVASIYVILFTYTIEIYPTPARSRGFGVNNAISKLAPVFFPFLIEFLPELIFYIYLTMNVVCMILIIFLFSDTLGKPLKEVMKEHDIEVLKKNIKEDK